MPGWNQASPIEGVLAVSEPHLPLLFAAEPPVEFLRLLPITAKEARFASEHGPERLAEALRASGVPLDDTFRPGML
jgi:Suppressor of fused protein (SUFU)